jgi:hypothetical protein
LLKERYILASERIREIPEEKGMVEASFEGFFQTLARLILTILSLAEEGDEERRGRLLEEIFDEISPGAYEKSFACPSFACQKLGEDLGRPLSVLYYEICGSVLPALSGSLEEMLIRMELFLEIYQAFMIEFRETGTFPEGRYITGKIRQYLEDYFRQETLFRLQDLTCEDSSGREDPFSVSSDWEAFFSPASPSLLSEGRAEARAEALAEALADRLPADPEGKDFGDAPAYTCGLGVSLGPDNINALTKALERRGIRAFPYVGRRSLFDIREDLTAPACSLADPRFYTDHREDLGLFLDESLRTRILQALEGALSEEGEDLSSFAGWILPGREKEEGALRPDPMAVRYGRHQKKLLSGLTGSFEEMIREAGLFMGAEDVFRATCKED